MRDQPPTAPAPGDDRPVLDRLGMIRHQQVLVKKQLGTQPETGRAGTVRCVEREMTRGKLPVTDPALGTGVLVAQQPLRPGRRDRLGHPARQNLHQAVTPSQGRLNRVSHPRPAFAPDHQPVDDQFDCVFSSFLQLDRFGHIDHFTVDPGADETFCLDPRQHIAKLAFAIADQRRQQHHPCPLAQGHDLVHDLARGLGTDRPTALVTMRLANARKQQPQVLVDLCRGRNRRARIGRGGALLDGNRRR